MSQWAFSPCAFKGNVRNCCWPGLELGIFHLENCPSLGLMLVHSPNQRNFALEWAAVFTYPAAPP